jgi:hypothetical protein
VQETVAKMLDRASALETELEGLVTGIHESAGGLVQRIRDAGGELEDELESIRGELVALRPVEPPALDGEDEELEAPVADLPSAIEPEPEPEPEPVAPEPASAANGASEEAAPAPVSAAAPAGGGGPEGARLVALNMALNGTPREEAARYLTDNFTLDDQDAILDDVYSRVGG